MIASKHTELSYAPLILLLDPPTVFFVGIALAPFFLNNFIRKHAALAHVATAKSPSWTTTGAKAASGTSVLLHKLLDISLDKRR